MKKFIFIMIGLSVLLFSGCNTAINLNPMTDNESAVITTDLINKYNSDGVMFINSFNQILNSGQIIYFMACPTTKNVYFTRMGLSANTAPVRIELFEDPIITDNGTPINLISTNRELNTPHESDIYMNPTITNEGNRLFVDAVSGNNKVMNDFSLTGELVLAKNKCYIIKITNEDGNNNEIFGTLMMYEK